MGSNYSRYGGECEKVMISDRIVKKTYGPNLWEKLLLRAGEMSRQLQRMSLQDTIDIVRSHVRL